MTELATRPGPVRGSERVEALDVLRGVAVLGILVMNVQSFAMPFAAYSNPSVWTSGDALDLTFWGLAYVFAEQKFMSIFSLLFGAGVALMLDRLEKRRQRAEDAGTAGPGADAGDTENGERAPGKVSKGSSVRLLHYRRTLGLLLIGLAHAYLLWYGDILVTYALCALALYPLRRVRPSRLLAAGIVILLVPLAVGRGYAVYLDGLPPEERAAAKAGLVASEEQVAAEVEAYRGGWLQQMPTRAGTAILLQTVIFLFFVAWRAGGLMLIGMALYKWGVVTARRPPPFYRRLALWGFVLGFPPILAGLVVNLRSGFAFDTVMLTNGVLNYLGSAGVALGYVALVMLWCHPRQGPSEAVTTVAAPMDAPVDVPVDMPADTPVSAPAEATAESPLTPSATAADAVPGLVAALRRGLAATGRMALTNYLMQTVLCVLVFYGYGLGWFGHLGRAAQWWVVLGVWALELAWSPWWLARFRFGPFEWLWRSFTYWRWQPLRRSSA